MTDPFDRMLALIAEIDASYRAQAALEQRMFSDMSDCFARAVGEIDRRRGARNG